MLGCIQITVGRMSVIFTCRKDERITLDSNGRWLAEYESRAHVGPGQYEYEWNVLGWYEDVESAAKALYVERIEFNASYGCDYASGVD